MTEPSADPERDMSHAARARKLIDAAHARDPGRAPDGRPAELVYADRIEAWVRRLVPDAPDLLRLAARCQHIERWQTPRASYPDGRAGYFAWRTSLYKTQSARARALLLEAGFAEAEADAAARWVAKEGLKSDRNTQALEDAACLVFLENEIAGFASEHATYPREKFVAILRKTLRKMSPVARTLALALNLPEPICDLVRDAARDDA